MRLTLAIVAALLASTAGAAESLPPALHPDLKHLKLAEASWELGLGSKYKPQQACVADVCQPRVWVPGFEPKFSLTGRRTELALTYLDRMHLEPFATVAWWLVATGLRFDYSADMRGGPLNGPSGRIRFQALLRWRLDAFNRPIFAQRHPGSSH